MNLFIVVVYQFLLNESVTIFIVFKFLNLFVTGNLLYSSSLLNKSSYRSITYVHQENINKAINTNFFTHLDPISSEIYEVKSLKKHIIQNLLVHLGLSVYCESKVHMLKFYYHFLKKYQEDKYFTLLFSDTDSIYVAISRPTLEDCVKPSLRKEYFTVKREWMPANSCSDHFDE